MTTSPDEQSSDDQATEGRGGAQHADVGVTGLATMGRNLARNMAHHGRVVAVHNRTGEKTRTMLEEVGHEGTFVGCDDLAGLVASLRTPRVVVIMVSAGKGTDAVIDELAGLLEAGDVVVDGGNAHFADTQRREAALATKGIHLLGTGISGGEVGALEGPSIMPGGTAEAYAVAGPLLEDISAHVDGQPCCTHIGPDGAGHFVKMVHNGIEYADMQLLGEAYDLLRSAGMEPAEIAAVLRSWDEGPLGSFLVQTAATVLEAVDADTGRPFVDVVKDAAEQKGTGRWTVQIALDLGVPVGGIAEAVFARSASGHPEQRDPARVQLPGPHEEVPGRDRDALVADLEQALWATKVVAYAQGFDLLRAASTEHDWDVDLAGVATIWRAGCIIRARLLEDIRAEFSAYPDLPSLLLAPSLADGLARAQEPWRRAVVSAVKAGVPVPGLSSALAAYDGLRRDRSPAALVQGMRDLFGAHTYARVDREGTFHRDWSGDGAEHER